MQASRRVQAMRRNVRGYLSPTLIAATLCVVAVGPECSQIGPGPGPLVDPFASPAAPPEATTQPPAPPKPASHVPGPTPAGRQQGNVPPKVARKSIPPV